MEASRGIRVRHNAAGVRWTRAGRRWSGQVWTTLLASALVASLAGAPHAVAAQTNPATPQELMQRLQEAQKALDKLSPDQKKMLGGMGIALPDPATMPPITAQDMARATGQVGVPRKDAARIARIGAPPLTPAALAAYLADIQGRVAKGVKPQAAALGEKLYRDMKAQGKTPGDMGKAAVGLWVFGRVETALDLMARVSRESPDDTDNLNNLAAMLSMAGEEHLAIPLLNALDKQFPRNATLLNNLGQAWFGLGEADKAEQYLQAALARAPNHVQANVTRSHIQEARGDKAGAIASMKRAAQVSYGPDKRNRLRKLGYSPRGEDVSLPLPFKPDSDPMGLHGFKSPPIPKTAEEELASAADWRAFNGTLEAQIAQLARTRQQLSAPGRQAANRAAHAVADGRPVPLVPEDKPPYFEQAVLKLKAMEQDGGARFRQASTLKALNEVAKRYSAHREAYWKERNQLDARAARQTGEGQANADLCGERNAVVSQYLAAYNTEYDERLRAYLDATRQYLNEELFWLQFKETPERFPLAQVDRQTAWLAALAKAGQHFTTGDAQVCARPPQSGGNGTLADFYDVHCDYHSELDFAGFAKIRSDCNKMTTTLGVGFLKLGLTQDMDKETFADQFLACSVEASAGVSSKVKTGPVEFGVQAGGSVGIEIGRSGIQDIYVTGGVGASAESGPVGFDMGATARVSLVSGASSLSGTGLLSD